MNAVASRRSRASWRRFALSGALAAMVLRPQPAAAQVNVNAFDLPPGASVTITFEVDVDNPLSPCASSVSNQGTVTAGGGISFLTDDPDVGGASNPTVTPLDAIDLAITKTDGQASDVPGTTVTYTIVASNAGPVGAIGVTVADTFAPALTGCTTSSVAAGGATGNDAGPFAGPINDSGLNLPPLSSVTYTTTCTIAADATGTLANTASVTQSGSQVECNTADNSQTDNTNLTPQADVAITKTNGVTQVDAGGSTTYTIFVSNASGPSVAGGVTVADTFDFTKLSTCSTTSVAAGGATGNDAGPFAGNINDSGISLPVGGTVTYTSVCGVQGTATGTLSNTATVSTSATDPNGGNNSATDGPDTINALADLSVTKNDGVTVAVPGMSVTYTIVAANAGPASAVGALVADTFPAACSTISWTCVGANGGTCTAGPVASNINDSVNLPAGGTATYTAVCTLSASAAPGTLSNTVAISGGGVSDNAPGNNSATDNDTILPLDYGDAADPAYPTLLASNGARHAVNGGSALRMGSQLDTEADGQPTANADGDDQVSGPNVDDEDGVTFTVPLVACESAAVTVVASAPGARLDAFVDFDDDGSFADAGEKVFSNLALAVGSNPLNFTVPCTVTPDNPTAARFRISTAGALSYDGVAADGEVEDHAVSFEGLDFGDAPDPTFPTLLASNGARHVVTGTGPVLGGAPDTEPNGQPSAGATGDDANGTDDENGVTLTGPFVRGQSAPITVTASAVGVVNAWVDWNADGNWTTAGDAVLVNQAVVAGANNLSLAVPGSATPGATALVRFRIASGGGLSFTGLAADGEVEDMTLAIAPEADLTVTKTDGATSEVPGTTVTYTIVATNAGPNPATGVTVADDFPAILTGCNTTSAAGGGATGNDSPMAGDFVDSGIDMPVGSTVTYTSTCTVDAAATGSLVNTATISSAVIDPVPGNNSATDTDTLSTEPDLSITKTDGAVTEVPGTPVTYTIVATNNGPSVSVGAAVTDTFTGILSGCSTTSVAAGGATGNDPGPFSGPINDTGLNLPVGATVTYTSTCNIAASATGTLANTAAVATGAGESDPNTGNNSATDTDTLQPSADLSITKTDGVTIEVPGTTVTYTITASNAGPSNAPGATVADAFPGILSGVTWTCVGAGGGTCTAAGAGNIGDTVNLPAGGSVTYTATGTIAASATGTLANTATVAAPGSVSDPNTGNNSATDTDTLAPEADLEITKDDSADPPPAGEDLVYTITVENLGPSDAAGVVVTDPLPAEVTYVSDDCGASNVPPWTWNVGALAAGATVTCDITVSIAPAPPPSISNTATVTSSTTDPVGGNDSDTELTELDAVAPKVLQVDSQAGTGDGSLDECETATVGITALRLSFDEEMNDPAGDSDPGDVTNPASYLLVTPGADFDFQTSACGGAAGDDVAVTIAAVTYVAGTDVATLHLAAPLASAQHRLYACDSLTDLAGNELDGDDDDTAGGDFRRAFRSDPGNLFANGHFDCDLSDWTVTAANPAEIVWTGLEDADGADDSGVAHYTNLAPGVDTTFSLGQCYPVPPVPQLDASHRLRLDAAAGVLVGFNRNCEFFSAAGCSGAIATHSGALVLGDTGGAFLTVSQTVPRPAGAVSARCAFVLQTATGAAFDAYLDATTLSAPGLIFADGFESGNTSAWSLTVP